MSRQRRSNVARRLALLLGLAAGAFVVFVLGVVAYIGTAVSAGGVEASGRLAGLGVKGPVRIDRDERGIPHVRAQNERDLFFAEGYVQGSDRLFQLDVYRRLVAGRLAEVLGSLALRSDLAARTFDVAAIVRDQERRLGARERLDLAAFADGVNAAIRTRPLPPEFRVLGYQPEPWRPRDSLLVAFATVLSLTDTWNDVATRAVVVERLGPAAVNAFFPITDPAYDAPTTSHVHAPTATLPPLVVAYPTALPLYATFGERAGLGSNEFAAGAAETATHRALLANDPHLGLHIPGIWYLVDMAAPGMHVAGATFAGLPGIILGHDEHVAWGATNATVTTVRVYHERFRSATSDEYLVGNSWLGAQHRIETFRVRFGKTVEHDYLRTRHGFVFGGEGSPQRLAAAWTADADRRSAFGTFAGLDRARDVDDALHALADYPGPAQNFVLADDRGRAGYVMAGEIPIDSAWGLRAYDGPSVAPPAFHDVPFAQLPQVAPARSAVVFTSNNRVYGAGYPYRLTAAFEPPYRAARVARDLRRQPYDVAAFSAIQADVLSLPERDLARAVEAALARKPAQTDADLRDALAPLAEFDGHFVESSRGAVIAWALRRAVVERLVRLHMPPELGRAYLSGNSAQALVAVLRMLREHPRGWVPNDDFDAFLVGAARDAVAGLRRRGQFGKTWSDVGGRVAEHPLAALGLSFWNGTAFPGHGDAYSPHVQGADITQSFRAVWDVGNWDAGGIVIPQGESGEPGSPHYRDAASSWLAGTLVPLPFSDAAVTRASTVKLTLTP